MDAVLKVEKLVKQVGHRGQPGAFQLKADFEVGAADRVALVGRSGAGKTTLLRCIAGLERLDSGKILIEGKDCTTEAVHLRRVGYVFQDQALFPALNVIENVVFGLRMRGVDRRTRLEEGRLWLARAGLEGLAERSVDHLSGGERQRVALLRAMIWRPRILLLDEPFSGLDAAQKEAMGREVLRLLGEQSISLILVSHDPEDCARLSTRRLEIRENSFDGSLNQSVPQTREIC